MAHARQLAVERMEDAALWRTLLAELGLLVGAQLGQMGLSERRGRAERAYECAYELRIRGVQLSLDLGRATR